MHGDSFNRVSLITLESGAKYVLRVPRYILEKTCQDLKDQVAITSHLAPPFSIPAMLAYDITVDNAIKSPYAIQKLAPGQRLDGVYDSVLPIEERLHIFSLVADLIVWMEHFIFLTPGQLATANRCDDWS